MANATRYTYMKEARMASNRLRWAALVVVCVTVEIAHAQYPASYGVHPPGGHSSYGVYPPHSSRAPAYIAPQSSAQAEVNAYGAVAAPPSGYPLHSDPYRLAQQGGTGQPAPPTETIPPPMGAPMAPPAAQPAPSPQATPVGPSGPVYHGPAAINYSDVAQGYVHEAMTNCQPAATVRSPWSGAQFGYAHRGCGPTYPAWNCDDGSCGPRMGNRLKGRLVGDAGACESAGAVSCGGGPKWFASAYGMLLKRTKSSFHPLSEDPAGSTIALSASCPKFPYQGGVEVRIGRYLNPEVAMEGAWWTIFDEPVESIAYGADYAGGLASRVDYSALDIVQGGGPAANVQSYYDGAWTHRVRKSFSVTNVELNVLQIPICGAPCMSCGGCDSCGVSCAPPANRGLSLSWHVGARYLRLDEELQFATDFANATWGDGVDEVFHDIDMENHLVGTQAGGHMFLPITCRLSLFSNASVGVFNNHMRQDQRVYNADGWAYVNAGPYAGQDLRVRTRDNHTAVMGELRTGVHYQFTHRWRGTFIYRTMGLANVALPEHQIPGSFADLQDVRKIRGNGSIVLHGFMFGMETRF